MRLILIRHAEPVNDTSKPASDWPISDAGRQDGRRLGRELAPLGIGTIISSREPKSVGTSEEVAAELGLRFAVAPDLHEHERDRRDWLGDDAWHELLRNFFDNPSTLVFGNETAAEALDRFSSGLEQAILSHYRGDGTIAVVSHGTVISLFAARHLGQPPYSIWKSLQMPDYVELDRG